MTKLGWSLWQYLIILLLGVTLIPLVMATLISFWQYGQDIDRIEQVSKKQTMGVARLVERYLLYALEDTRKALLTIAGTMTGTPDRLANQLSEVTQSHPQFAGLVVTDATGLVMKSSARPNEGRMIDELESFSAAQTSGQLIYTNYFVSQLISQPVVAMVLPYYQQPGQFAGVIRASISLEFLLREFTNQYPFEERYYIFFVDRRGTILAAQNFGPGRNIKNNPPVEALIKGQDDTIKYVSTFFGDRVDGEERLGAFRHIGETGWGVVVSQPSAHVLVNPLRNLRNFLVFIVLTVIVCFLVALGAARRLIRPLDMLAAEMTRRTDRQDFHLETATLNYSGIREFRLLTQVYRTLMKQIRQNFEKIGTLNTEISDSNACLQAQNIESRKQAERIQSQLQELDTLYRRVNEVNLGLETQVAERTSELRAAYHRLADKATELEEANAKLTELVGELRKLDQLQADFLANISHELRTPITFIAAYGSSLEDGLLGTLSAEQAEAIHCIMEGADRLTTLVEDLLDLNCLEAGAFELSPVAFPPANMIDPIVEGARAFGRAKRQNVLVEIGADVPLIFADLDRTQQVLRNLLSNAMKFTAEGGTIHIRCYADKAADGVITEVSDNGIGIPEEAVPRLFDRFYQVDSSSTRKHGGTGIGLNIVKNLLELMGGRIAVESTVGQGSTFRYVLPASEHVTALLTENRAKEPVSNSIASNSGSLRHPDILEDDESPPLLSYPKDEELIG
ncbi:MAG: hypothetical protein HY692_04545 [Cyanobacteria bacterium NC_groundwater_1444_Ag_S-0.65um_54_12]|nr:hypothetical protein [Cyanobacteria bacterium NC_groundwater_1444_Ag_S-0.65um_54_12]